MTGRVLITGGLGNLGSWITKEFCDYGYDVYLLTRKEKHRINSYNYNVIECDITDLPGLEEKLKIDFDYCIHLASFNEFFYKDYPGKALKINTLGTRNILEVLSKKSLKRFVYFSTFHVYGAVSGVVNEESELWPRNDYAATHLFAEYYVKQFNVTHNLQYTIFRLSNSYGTPTFIDSEKWYLVLNDLAKTAYETGKIIIKSNGQAKRDFIWMGDVARIVRLSLTFNENDTFNLSSKKTNKITELAEIVKDEYEKRYKKTIEIEVNHNDKTVYNNLLVDNTKLKLKLDFKLNEMFQEEVNNIFDLLEKS